MQKTKGVAVGIENCAALHIKDDTFRIISSRKNKKAFLIHWTEGKYVKQALLPSNDFQSLAELMI